MLMAYLFSSVLQLLHNFYRNLFIQLGINLFLVFINSAVLSKIKGAIEFAS